MTFSRFFGFGFLLWIVLVLFKGLFFNAFNPHSVWIGLIYALVSFTAAVACVRRLGVINYLEGAMVAILWIAAILLGDLIFLRAILRWDIFHDGIAWITYLLVVLAIFLFHKKRHVEVRKELAAHHSHH